MSLLVPKKRPLFAIDPNARPQGKLGVPAAKRSKSVLAPAPNKNGRENASKPKKKTCEPPPNHVKAEKAKPEKTKKAPTSPFDFYLVSVIHETTRKDALNAWKDMDKEAKADFIAASKKVRQEKRLQEKKLQQSLPKIDKTNFKQKPKSAFQLFCASKKASLKEDNVLGAAATKRASDLFEALSPEERKVFEDKASKYLNGYVDNQALMLFLEDKAAQSQNEWLLEWTKLTDEEKAKYMNRQPASAKPKAKKPKAKGGYNIFCAAKRKEFDAEIEAGTRAKISFGEQNTLLGELWKELPVAIKEEFKAAAQQEFAERMAAMSPAEKAEFEAPAGGTKSLKKRTPQAKGGYNMFCAAKRKEFDVEIEAGTRAKIPFGEQSKLLGELWKTLPAAIKEEFTNAGLKEFENKLAAMSPAERAEYESLKKPTKSKQPTKPRSGYIMFCAAKRKEYDAEIEAGTREKIPFGEQGKLNGEMWKELAQSEKEMYKHAGIALFEQAKKNFRVGGQAISNDGPAISDPTSDPEDEIPIGTIMGGVRLNDGVPSPSILDNSDDGNSEAESQEEVCRE